MPVLFPCGVCCKPVAVNHRAVQCDICDLWIHIKCNAISPALYKEMMELDTDLKWCCIKCINAAIPFSETPDEILKLTFQGKNPDYSPVLIANQSDDFVALLNALEKADFSNGLDEDNDPNQHVNNCFYHTLSEFNSIKNKGDSLNFFHLNIASLSLHSGELNSILINADVKFDFIGISETGLNVSSSNYEFNGYKHLDCPTESTKGCVRLYFSDRFNFERREDLRVYESKQLESIFIEILSENKGQNLIVGCIYKHPKMDVSEFNKHLYNLLEKVSREKKKIVLMGDFNIDLLKLDLHDESSSYFDIISSFGLLPSILRPTRITSRSATLIDNIFSNFGDVKTTSGNLVCPISDHLPQFTMFNFLVDKKTEKTTAFVRNYKNFNRENFLLDFLNIDWKNEFVKDPNLNLAKFISKTNELINQSACAHEKGSI